MRPMLFSVLSVGVKCRNNCLVFRFKVAFPFLLNKKI
jgi:hypothetical protein